MGSIGYFQTAPVTDEIMRQCWQFFETGWYNPRSHWEYSINFLINVFKKIKYQHNSPNVWNDAIMFQEMLISGYISNLNTNKNQESMLNEESVLR
jgi:hypothetical protein